MITGQLIVYRYNNLINAKPDVDRNLYVLKDINAATKEGFQQIVEDSLDEVPMGAGYVLVKWNNRLFLCEKDTNNPGHPYVKHEVSYHPLSKVFTI